MPMFNNTEMLRKLLPAFKVMIQKLKANERNHKRNEGASPSSLRLHLKNKHLKKQG